METILALDPGITTGYVLAVYNDTLGRVDVYPGQEKLDELGLYMFLQNWQAKHIVYEAFEFRQRSRDNLELFSRNLIGVTRLHAQERGYPHEDTIHLYEQKPAVGEGGAFKGSTALKELGIYVAGDECHHGMSALRHFMMWWTFGAGYKYCERLPKLELADKSRIRTIWR